MHIFNQTRQGHTFLLLFLISFLIVSGIILNPIYCNAETQTFSQDIYHAHTGDAKNGGGCFTIAKKTTTTVEERCGGKIVYFPDYGTSQCNYCGKAYSGDKGGQDCIRTTPREETITTYEMGCNKNSKTVLGSFSVTKSTEEWTKSLNLNMTFSPVNVAKKTAPFFYVNSVPCESDTYTVAANGTYGVKLNTATGFSAPVLNIDVTNIDVTAPKLTGYSVSPEDWTTQDVTVCLTGAEDLQPDNTPGCGLHDLPFSYDDGQTWTADTSHTYTGNNSYTVLVRDKLNNIATEYVNVKNVDIYPPSISIDYDTTPNVKSVVVTVNACDLQPDNTPGCGLHETAFSFDSGKTWQTQNTMTVDKCCSLTIKARDKLNNIASSSVSIENIDCFGPAVSHTLNPAKETKGPVLITVTAHDTGFNNSEGIGLAEHCYSFDNQLTWTDQNTLTVRKNGTYYVVVKDKNDNITKHQIKVTNISSTSDVKPPAADNPNPPSDDTPPSAPEDIKPEEIPDAPPKPSPATKPIATPPEQPVAADEPTPSPANPPVLSTKKPSKEIKKETKTIEQKDLKAENTITPETVSRANSNNGIKTIIILLIAALLIVSLIMLLLFLLYRAVLIKNLVEQDKYSLKGVCFIRKNESFEIHLPSSIIDNCTTNKFRLRFSRLFIFLHNNENVIVYTPDKQSYIVTPSVDTKMSIRL